MPKSNSLADSPLADSPLAASPLSHRRSHFHRRCTEADYQGTINRLTRTFIIKFEGSSDQSAERFDPDQSIEIENSPLNLRSEA